MQAPPRHKPGGACIRLNPGYRVVFVVGLSHGHQGIGQGPSMHMLSVSSSWKAVSCGCMRDCDFCVFCAPAPASNRTEIAKTTPRGFFIEAPLELFEDVSFQRRIGQ